MIAERVVITLLASVELVSASTLNTVTRPWFSASLVMELIVRSVFHTITALVLVVMHLFVMSVAQEIVALNVDTVGAIIVFTTPVIILTTIVVNAMKYIASIALKRREQLVCIGVIPVRRENVIGVGQMNA